MRIDKHDPTIDEFKKYYPSLYASEKETFPLERGYVAPYGSLPFTYENVAENVYLDSERREQALYNTFALVLSRRLRKDYPSVKIESLYAMVLRQRMIKSKD